MSFIRTLGVLFDQKITRREIVFFRGAIINSDKTPDDVALHGHTDEGYNYSYPLVQYKSINGQAAIVGIENGVSIVEQLISSFPQRLMLGRHDMDFNIVETYACSTDLDFVETPIPYKLKDWLPLSQDNYGKYKRLTGMADQVRFLEQILVGNILSMAKGLGIVMAERIVVSIVDVRENPSARLKENMLSCFDLTFTSNVRLPVFAGLGKGVSKGYGTIGKEVVIK